MGASQHLEEEEEVLEVVALQVVAQATQVDEPWVAQHVQHELASADRVPEVALALVWRPPWGVPPSGVPPWGVPPCWVPPWEVPPRRVHLPPQVPPPGVPPLSLMGVAPLGLLVVDPLSGLLGGLWLGAHRLFPLWILPLLGVASLFLLLWVDFWMVQAHHLWVSFPEGDWGVAADAWGKLSMFSSSGLPVWTISGERVFLLNFSRIALWASSDSVNLFCSAFLFFVLFRSCSVAAASWSRWPTNGWPTWYSLFSVGRGGYTSPGSWGFSGSCSKGTNHGHFEWSLAKPAGSQPHSLENLAMYWI